MKPWLWLSLLLALTFGLAESHSALRLDRILGLVTGNSEPTKASEADLAQDEAALAEEEESGKAEDEELISEAEYDDEDPKKPPNHPIPLPPPPSLPHLPPLFPPRETITATKTLYAEVTKRVTRHPVCMTVYGVKPPCLPIELHAGHHHGSDCYKREETEYETGLFNEGLDEGLYIEPTAALKIPSATATATTQLQQDSDSANSEEGDLLALAPSREGRYLEFRRHTPTPSASAETDLEETARLINILPPETNTVTQTLWVTKVQKVIDHRITATLQAKNCVPVDLKIPFCPPSHKPPPKPTVIVVKPPHKPTVHKPTVPKPPVVLPPIHKPPILLPPIHKPPLLPTIKPPYQHEGYKPTGHWKEGENEDKNDEAETDESEAIAQDEVFEDESS